MITVTTGRTARFSAGVAVLTAAALTLPVGAASAEDGGGVDVVNTETVQVYTDASGTVEAQRIYEQLSLIGQGAVEFDNPVASGDLRNLDGFSGFDVSEGVQHVEAEVDGAKHLRSVSDFDGDLPLDLTIEYRLDGEVVEPGDVVGESGDLEVTYTVKNVTGEPQEISYPDGEGGTITETVEVPLPMVGSLSTTLPSSFTEVQSGEANMAGDGQGGTKLSFTMTLLPPIGSDTATFGYTAKIRDAVVPPASISALPVDPMQSPTFKSAAASYQGGADTGTKLTAGAQEIDANLLRIRDGASELLSGLIQLHEGSQELSAGLQGEAAPGAEELAAGAKDLRNGLGQIDDGAGRLANGANRADEGGSELAAGAGDLRDGLGQIDEGASDLAAGAKQLSGGTGDALTGSQKLESGLQLISGGLGQLAGADGLPKALAGANELKAGVDTILARVGTTDTDGTLLGGLHDLEVGLAAAAPGSAQLLGGLQQLRGDGSEETPGLAGAKHGVDQVQAGLAAAVAPGGSLDRLIGGLQQLAPLCGLPGAPSTCGESVQGLIDGATASKSQLSAANQGLLGVSGGLTNAIEALDSLLIPGAEALNSGIGEAHAGAGRLLTGAQELRGGLTQVQAGLAVLVQGLTDAVTGVDQLSGGAGDAASGAGDLVTGLSQIDAGAGQLADGAGRLSDGTGDAKAGSQKLAAGAGELSSGLGDLSAGANELAAGTGEASDGSGRLADGAGRLADGIGDAAEGSGRLEDGLGQAREAAPALPQGAGRLSEEGMSQLVAAGKSTAKDYGKLYATVAAGSERAQGGTMAFGAPEDARGLMAYSFEIKGEDGEGGRNLARGVGALVLGGLGLGAFALRRRFV